MQLNKSKLGIKNGTKVTLRISSNVVGDYNDENNFPYKLLFDNTQASRLYKAFADGFLANIKSAKAQLHKVGQSEGLVGRLLRTSTKNGIAFNRKYT